MSKTKRGPWSDRLDDETRGIVEGLEKALAYHPPDSPVHDYILAGIDRIKRPEGWPKGAPLPEFLPQKGDRVRWNVDGRTVVVGEDAPIWRREWFVVSERGTDYALRHLTPAPTTGTVTLKATDAMVDAYMAEMDIREEKVYGRVRACLNAALAAAPITVDPTLTDEQITARFAGMDVEVGR